MRSDRKTDRKVVAWLPLGMILPVIALSLPRFYHPASMDWFDGLRGLIAGIGFGIMIMVIVKLVRQRRLGAS
jgi:hypothetical protein